MIHRALRSPLALLLLFAFVLSVTSAGTGLAHAGYERSTPGRSTAVPQSPARVDIYTSQEMAKDATKTEITVTDPNKIRVDTADTVVDDRDRKHLSVGLKPNLPAGRYVVSFRNVSDEDGEADHGQFAFYVGSPPTAAMRSLDAKLNITKEADGRAGDNRRRELLLIGVSSGIAVAVIALIIVVQRRRKR